MCGYSKELRFGGGNFHLGRNVLELHLRLQMVQKVWVKDKAEVQSRFFLELYVDVLTLGLFGFDNCDPVRRTLPHLVELDFVLLQPLRAFTG